MDIEQKQEEIIDHFVKQASSLEGSALGSLVVEATSHPSLFAFSEILAVPNVVQLEGTETSVNLDVLRLFSQGTWSDYKSGASRLPQLLPDQVLKLKQLTVLTLAETNKVLPYDQLMQELDVINVRELEDFLINECMYAGIVRGKLDQLRKCFEVQFAAGRDPRPGQLGSMIHTLSNWLDTSNNLLISIQEKMKWADTMTELAKEHKKEVEDRVEEVKKSSSHKADIDFRGHEEIYSEPGGVMDYEEDRSRPKRIMCTYQANRIRASNLAILQDHQGDSVLKRLRGSHLGVPQLSPQGYICYATHRGDNWLDKFWIEIL